MSGILCCGRRQKVKIFKIKPTKKDIHSEYILFLEKCSFCQKSALEIVRLDIYDNIIEKVRLKTKNIPAFLKKIEIIRKYESIFHKSFRRTSLKLYYNEFGVKKLCYQNLSNINIGKIEGDPLFALKIFMDSKRMCPILSSIKYRAD